MEKHSRSQSSSSGSPSKTGQNEKQKGLTVLQTSFFIMGDVAGSGILALPNAVMGTGYIGVLLIIVFCVMAAYAGMCIGRCWNIVEARFTEYQEEVRQPYQCIGEKSFGKWMKILVTVCLDFTSIGSCVVYTLLIAEMLRDLFTDIWPVSICYWALIVSGVLIPLSWLGTPKDFWPLAALASITVLVACILILTQCFLELGTHGPVYYPAPTFKSFCLAFGTILFAYGGAAAFPTFQNDMKHRKKFTSALLIGFIAIVTLYLLVACSGYFIFGYNVRANITETIKSGPLSMASQVLLVIHLFCAFIVVINPSFQDLEEYIHLQKDFGWQRILFRTLIVGCILFVGETIPQFSKIQNLIGGSTTTALAFIFPVVFYLKLCSQKDPRWEDREIPLHEKAFIWEIIVIGIVGGVASTVSAVWDIASPNSLTVPCYVSLN